jgi:hypothetical protein
VKNPSGYPAARCIGFVGLPLVGRPRPGGKHRPYRTILSSVLCLLTSVLCFTGCAGYHLGTGSTAKFRTLFIAPITSEALIPQAQVLVTTQLREAFIRDGRITLVNSAEAADAVLNVTLAGYNRTVAVSRPDDTGLARRFDVRLQARATLLDNRTKQPYFSSRSLEAARGVFTDSGLVSSEYQALPLLAGLIASEAVHAVLDTW